MTVSGSAGDWPYAVALAWEWAARSLQTDRDRLNQYVLLQGVWERIQHLLGLHALGVVTPSDDDLPSAPIGLLALPSNGLWQQFLQTSLPRTGFESIAPIARLSECLWEPVERPAAAAMIRETSELLHTSRPIRGTRLALDTVLSHLIWLRNRSAHRFGGAWTPAFIRRVVELLRDCIEEILADRKLSATLRLTVANEETIDLCGSAPLAERASATFWRTGNVHGGPNGEIDLRGLALTNSCPRCRELQLLVLNALGDPLDHRAKSAPRYACAGCGEKFRFGSSEGTLRRRLGDSMRGSPWVETRQHYYAQTGRPVRVAFEVSNPLLRDLENVCIEAELPDSMDQEVVRDAEDALRVGSLRRGTSARVELLLKPRAPGVSRVVPRVTWGMGERLELEPITVEVHRARRVDRLIGRDAELRELESALERAKVSGDGFALVEGRSGVGRTALLDGFVDRLPSDVIVLRSRCEWDPLRPTQPLVELVLKFARYYLGMTQWNRGGRPSDILLFAGGLLEAIAQVADEAGFDIPSARAARPRTVAESAMDLAYAEAFIGFCDAIGSNRPAVVLCLDEIQDAHPRTLRLLRSLASSLARRPLLIIGTRTLGRAGRDPLHDRELAELLAMANWRFPLQPLSQPDVDRLIDLTYPVNTFNRSFRDRVWEATRGQPLFVCNLLSSLEETGVVSCELERWQCTVPAEEIELPAEISRVIEQRLQRLPADYLQVVQRAAILGERFPPDILEGTLRANPGTLDIRDGLKVAQMLADLEETYDVVRTIGSEHEFSHRKLWNSAYHQLNHRVRQHLHEAVADYLERERQPSLERDVRITDHRISAAQAQKATSMAIDVGQRLLDEGRNEQAAWLLERAFQLVCDAQEVPEADRHELCVQTARASRRVGRLQEAIAFERRNLEHAKSTGNHEAAVKALLSQALCHQALHAPGEAERALRLAAEHAANLGNARELATVQAHWARALQSLGRHDEASDLARRCLAICAELRGMEQIRGDCSLAIAWQFARRGDNPAAIGAAVEARTMYETIGSHVDVARADYELSRLHADAGDLGAALSAARRALDLCTASGDVVGQARAHLRVGSLSSRTGSVQKADEHLDRAERFYKRQGDKIGVANCRLAQAWLAFSVDQSHRAEALARDALEAFGSRGYPSDAARARATILRAMIRHATVAELRQELQVDRDAQAEAAPRARLELGLAKAAALRFLDDRIASRAQLDSLRSHVEALGDPLARARWLFEDAVLLRVTGELDGAAQAVTEAAALFTRCGDAVMACQCRTMTAQIFVAQGRRDLAEPLLHELLDECRTLNDALGQALCLQELGRLARAAGDDATAETLFSQSSMLRYGLEDYRGIAVLAELPPLELN